MENTENNTFEYNYSSKKQEEIERIKEKYASLNQDDTLARLKAMDAEVEKRAAKKPIIYGTIGLILLALGMCGSMAIGGNVLFVLGIIVGVVGIALMAIAYPWYSKNVKEERIKAAPEILNAANEA